MSPKTTNRWKEIVQAFCTVAFLLAFFWLSSQGLSARGKNAGGVTGMFGFAAGPDGEYDSDDDVSDDEEEDCDDEEEDCDDEEGNYDDILSMPVCVDLSNSIATLQDIRNKVLKAVLDQDAQGIQATAGEYREAVQIVQAGFARLKTRVAPDDFADVAEELLDSCASDNGQSLMPSELGRFAEEIWQ
jgi:hypothetical protein